jgi:hypothetical protein
MAVNLSPFAGVGAQLFDNNGNVLAGGKIYSYAAGTNTPATVYTNSSGTIAHLNPIILDASGRVPGGEIWLTDGVAYKFVVNDAYGNLIATYDNLTGINSNFVAYTSQQEIQTATAGQTLFTLTTMSYQPGTNNLAVFVDGVNQYGPGAQYAYVETSSNTVTFENGLHVGALVKFTTAAQVSSAATSAANVSFIGFKGQIGNVENLASATGSDWIGFTQSGTGAVAISAQDKLRQFISVKDFGALGDGITNDTAAIQAAINSLGSIGGTLWFPSGNYIVSTSITASCPITVIGSGISASVITSTTANIDVLTFSKWFSISHISFSVANTSNAIVQSASSSNHQQSEIRNCLCTSANNFFVTYSPLEFVIDGNWITGTTAGIWFNSVAHPDQGDCYITNNTFIPAGNGTSAGIRITYGSGIYITANKFNGSGYAHIKFDGTNGGDYIIANNSLEGQPTYAIDLSPTALGGISKILINSNQFSGDVTAHVHINGSYRTTVTDNTFNNVTPSTGIGVHLVTCRYALITGNMFYDIGTGIYNTASAQAASVYGNEFTGQGNYCVQGLSTVLTDTFPQNFQINYAKQINITSNSVWTTIIQIDSYLNTTSVQIAGAAVGVGNYSTILNLANGITVGAPTTSGTGLLFQVSGSNLQCKLDPGTVATSFTGTFAISSIGLFNNVSR